MYLMDLLQTEEARMRLDRKRSLEIEIEVVLEMGKAFYGLGYLGRRRQGYLSGRCTVWYLNKKHWTEGCYQEGTYNLAVTLANDNNLRKYVEADILASSLNLLEQEKAVDEWQKMLLEISPYQQCTQSGNKDEL